MLNATTIVKSIAFDETFEQQNLHREVINVTKIEFSSAIGCMQLCHDDFSSFIWFLKCFALIDNSKFV